jgi:hypothetical protein
MELIIDIEFDDAKRPQSCCRSEVTHTAAGSSFLRSALYVPLCCAEDTDSVHESQYA